MDNDILLAVGEFSTEVDEASIRQTPKIGLIKALINRSCVLDQK